VITLFRFLSRLPLAWLHSLGFVVGWLTWLLSPTYRRHMHENMVLALGAAEAGRLRSAAIAEAGKGMLELPRVWLRPLAETASRVVEVSGWELVEAASRRGKGILYLTPHLGCFEVTAQYLSTHAPITVLYRPPKQAWLQTMIEAGRARAQLHLAAADLSGVRGLLKALKRGEAVGMLPDQAPRAGEGRWLDFFGRPAYTMTLAARLVETGASVIMVWAERLPAGAGYHFHLQAPTQPIRWQHRGAGATDQSADRSAGSPVPAAVSLGLQPLQAAAQQCSSAAGGSRRSTGGAYEQGAER
jgi:KDO2-lipid IV(A) lauroyltransferase